MFVPDPYSALRLSLVVGAWCVLLGLPIAVFFGYLLARRSFPGMTVLSTLLLAPLVMPPVVTGLVLLRVFGRTGPLGELLAKVGISIPFTLAGAVLAALVTGLPLFILTARAAFESVDPRYEELSRTLGKTPARTFLRVTLPLALPGLAAGAVLSFARSLGEFGATALLSGDVEGRTRTLSMAVYALLEAPGGEEAINLLVGVSLLASFAAVAGYDLLVRRQRRRMGWREAGRG